MECSLAFGVSRWTAGFSLDSTVGVLPDPPTALLPEVDGEDVGGPTLALGVSVGVDCSLSVVTVVEISEPMSPVVPRILLELPDNEDESAFPQGFTTPPTGLGSNA